jgi:predicted AlkP superfamily phosphohydrolase/phosphomutase
MTETSRQRLLAPLTLSFLLLLTLGAALVTGKPAGRVIVLGFDGADARTVQRMMDAGELPNLKKLAERGTFAPLRSTNPAESAAGWAAINTGKGPAKNGIPSFFGRRLKDGLPQTVPAHMESITRPTSEMHMGGVLGLLAGHDPLTVAGIAGLAVALGFVVLFLGVLRLRAPLALVLAVLFGGLAAYAAHRARGYVPGEVPNVTHNLIEADGFWKPAAENGVRAVVLDAALAFDRPEVAGARVLAGLGLPDCRGDIGEWFVYSTDSLELGLWPEGTPTNTGSGDIFKVDWQKSDGKIHAKLPGPVLFWEKERVEGEYEAVQRSLEDPDIGWEESKGLRAREQELKEQVDRFRLGKNEVRATADLVVERLGTDKVRVTIGKESQELSDGQWSGWYHLSFEINPLVSVQAVTRARVLSMGEKFELYVNTLDIDPSHPPFWQPISQPTSFAGDLVDWSGETYETVGWACMTNQIKDKKLPIEAFLEDVEFTETWREKLTYAALARNDWDLLFSVFTTADRVQHMMYKYTDAEHPKHDKEQAARSITFFGEPTTLADVIPAIYRHIDKIVGKVVDEYLKPEDTLLLCADHGFTSFRREMNVNNWLAEKGYLAIRKDLTTTQADSLDFAVDWSRTKAYCLGLGMIFVNQKGREAQGIVAPADARGVLEAIRNDFVEAMDTPVEGGPQVRAGHDAVILSDVIQGPYMDRCADMMLGFEENYRVSWATAGGKIDLKNEAGGIVLDRVYKDNTNNWCGDHASVSPEIVKGIFFCSRPVVVPESGVNVTHVGATALDLLGVPVPADYDDPPLARK